LEPGAGQPSRLDEVIEEGAMSASGLYDADDSADDGDAPDDDADDDHHCVRMLAATPQAVLALAHGSQGDSNEG